MSAGGVKTISCSEDHLSRPELAAHQKGCLKSPGKIQPHHFTPPPPNYKHLFARAANSASIITQIWSVGFCKAEMTVSTSGGVCNDEATASDHRRLQLTAPQSVLATSELIVVFVGPENKRCVTERCLTCCCLRCCWWHSWSFAASSGLHTRSCSWSRWGNEKNVSLCKTVKT